MMVSHRIVTSCGSYSIHLPKSEAKGMPSTPARLYTDPGCFFAQAGRDKGDGIGSLEGELSLDGIS